MDIFERHFSMLKENQDIFERNKVNYYELCDEKIQKDFSKCGRELLTPERSEQFLEVRSVHHYNVVMSHLEEYTFPEWLVCLEEKVLLEHAVPVFLSVLKEYPMLCGMRREWQVLYEITKVDQAFWKEHLEWFVLLKTVIKNVLVEHEKGTLKKDIPEEYLRCFLRFNS